MKKILRPQRGSSNPSGGEGVLTECTVGTCSRKVVMYKELSEQNSRPITRASRTLGGGEDRRIDLDVIPAKANGSMRVTTTFYTMTYLCSCCLVTAPSAHVALSTCSSLHTAPKCLDKSFSLSLPNIPCQRNGRVRK